MCQALCYNARDSKMNKAIKIVEKHVFQSRAGRQANKIIITQKNNNGLIKSAMEDMNRIV